MARLRWGVSELFVVSLLCWRAAQVYFRERRAEWSRAEPPRRGGWKISGGRSGILARRRGGTRDRKSVWNTASSVNSGGQFRNSLSYLYSVGGGAEVHCCVGVEREAKRGEAAVVSGEDI